MQRYRSIYLWSILLVFLFSAQAFSWSDGVWKPSDYSNNFWIQTYTTGSSLIIVSADGERFYVFLDPDVSDGFDVPELFGKDASLEVVFGQVGTSVDAQPATAKAVLEIAGETTQYTLQQTFEAACGLATLDGDAAGDPLSKLLSGGLLKR